MKIYLRDQQQHFHKHLDCLKQRSVSVFNKSNLNQRITEIQITAPPNFIADARKVPFSYQIFPNNIMTFFAQWNAEGRQMKVGDTIVQQAFLPPVQRISQKIVFGVRINKIIDQSDKVGFSYQTLEGHVEKGESTFMAEITTMGEPVFRIHTYSKPGTLLARIAGPLITIPYQSFCTKQALGHVIKQLDGID